MLIDYLETPAQFEIWLAKHQSNQYAGNAGNPCYCPIATFLKSKVNVEPDEIISVGATYIKLYKIFGNEVVEVIHTPQWIVNFIGRIDAMHLKTIANPERSVIVGACEEVLDLIGN